MRSCACTSPRRASRPRSRADAAWPDESPTPVTAVRSLAFNALFYLVLLAYFVVALPTLVMPRWAILRLARHWAGTNLRLLRIVCGIEVDWRGLENIPRGAVLIGAKHQSTWETFALLT